MKTFITVIGLLMASPAFAQSTYVPVILDEAIYNRMLEYLGEQPAKIAIPLINALQGLELAAQKAKLAAEAKPPEGKK